MPLKRFLFAAFMIGQKLDMVALFDSDDAGRISHDKLVKEWLPRYKESHTEVVMLGDAVGVDHDFELEDLFPEDFMKEVVKENLQQTTCGCRCSGDDTAR